MAYCKVHRREYGAGLANLFEVECPECKYDREINERREEQARARDEEQAKRARSIEEHREEQARARDEREAQRARETAAEEAEVAAERHRQLLAQHEADEEAADAHRERLEELERDRLEAEEARHDADREWREAQQLEKETEERRRELREGLPEFSADFQQEWARANEKLADVLNAERELSEALHAARREEQARTTLFAKCLSQLLEHLSVNPPKSLVVRPPEGAKRSWAVARERLAALLLQMHRNINVSLRPGAVPAMDNNLVALWLTTRMLARSGGSTTAGDHCQFFLNESRPFPGFAALGAAGTVAISSAFALSSAVQAAVSWRISLVLLDALYVVLAFVPAALVYLRITVPRSRRGLYDALAGFHSAAREVAASCEIKDSAPNLKSLSSSDLSGASDPTGLIRDRFSRLDALFAGAVGKAAPFWLPTIRGELDTAGDALGRATAEAAGQLGRSKKGIVELEGHSANPEWAAAKRQFRFLESEIRRAGRQILDGIRVRGPSIKLVRCPGCSGPVTSDTRACPYCGSDFAG